MNNPLVSIIMPAYNVERYISDSINSVINQTYRNWELIIIDDASCDDTSKIIKEFALKDNRIKPIFRKINSSRPSIAKNEAYNKITGEFVAFLDSDDLWLEDKLQKQVKLMKNTNYKLCYTGGYIIDENGNEIKSFLPQYQNGYIFKQLLFRYEINNQSVLISKDVFKKFNENIIIGEDYNFFMNIAFHFKICNIKEKLVKYRFHKKSITNLTYDLSSGTLFTLEELNNKYNILKKYPFEYIFCFIKAYRFKIFNKLKRMRFARAN